MKKYFRKHDSLDIAMTSNDMLVLKVYPITQKCTLVPLFHCHD